MVMIEKDGVDRLQAQQTRQSRGMIPVIVARMILKDGGNDQY